MMKNHLLLILIVLAASLSAQSKSKVDFERQVFPILKKHCIECHQATYVDKNGRKRRPKGRVMLDTLANINKSKRGKLFIANKPDDSLVMESITLPADDEDRMPPPKKGGPLAKKDVETIKSWIEQGADYGKWTGEKGEEKADDKDKKKGGSSKSTGSAKNKAGSKKKGPSPLVTLSKGLKPVPPTTLAAFANGPFQVKGVGDGNPLLTVSCYGKTDVVDDAALAQLSKVADNIYELDLARSNVSDAGCAVIAKMPRLCKLDLRQTKVSNQGARHLSECKELRSLNLFDTDIGDYALVAIAALKNLEQLYVWQTDVSTKGVVRLREALPTLRVVTFADLPDPNDDDGGR